jgi:hypothetical protein
MDDVTINVFTRKWQGSSYYCPHCKAILGVCINPLLIGDQIVADVVAALKKS